MINHFQNDFQSNVVFKVDESMQTISALKHYIRISVIKLFITKPFKFTCKQSSPNKSIDWLLKWLDILKNSLLARRIDTYFHKLCRLRMQLDAQNH